ncbi:MAG TPA: Asp23/Gls24 family envelope stress response protein, partial [Streptosporangiaceae bacterium]|nr:Asp23/Gls24 family envelope stress response protein [Streptosporangiaceae bacterium]
MTQTSSSGPSAKPATRFSETDQTAERLTTDDGKISVDQSVVQKIAGIACREISGVHAMGVSTSRAFGAVRE